MNRRYRIYFLLTYFLLAGLAPVCAQKVKLNHIYRSGKQIIGLPPFPNNGVFNIYYNQLMYGGSTGTTTQFDGRLTDNPFPATHAAELVRFGSSVILPQNDLYSFSEADTVASWFGRSIDVAIDQHADHHDSTSDLQHHYGTIRMPQPLRLTNNFRPPVYDSRNKLVWADTLRAFDSLHWQPDAGGDGTVFLYLQYDDAPASATPHHLKRWSMKIPDNGLFVVPVELLAQVPKGATCFLVMGRQQQIELRHEGNRRSGIYITATNFLTGNFIRGL